MAFVAVGVDASGCTSGVAAVSATGCAGASSAGASGAEAGVSADVSATGAD